MGRSCFNPRNSCICRAPVLSLVTVQRIAPSRITNSAQTSTRRLRRGGGSCAGGRSRVTGTLVGGKVTGSPQFQTEDEP